MGLTYYAYCGPFLCCEKTMKTVQEEQKGCIKRGCKQWHKAYHFTDDIPKFCPECGKAIGNWYVDVEQPVADWYDVFGDGARLWPADVGGKFDDYDIMVVETERAKNQPRVFQISDDNFGSCVNLTDPEKQQKELDWFKERYAKEITKCESAYGKDRVNPCWGFLTWIN